MMLINKPSLSTYHLVTSYPSSVEYSLCKVEIIFEYLVPNGLF